MRGVGVGIEVVIDAPVPSLPPLLRGGSDRQPNGTSVAPILPMMSGVISGKSSGSY